MKVTRGMRRRSAKLERRAQLVTPDTLIAGVDLARKESVVVFVRARDKVRLGRLRIPTTAEGVRTLARRAGELQRRHQLPRLVLGMEACSHFWKVVAKAATEIGLLYLIVQSFVLARAREFDDLTRDKTDPRDAALIADLVADDFGQAARAARLVGLAPPHPQPRRRRRRPLGAARRPHRLGGRAGAVPGARAGLQAASAMHRDGLGVDLAG